VARKRNVSIAMLLAVVVRVGGQLDKVDPVAYLLGVLTVDEAVVAVQWSLVRDRVAKLDKLSHIRYNAFRVLMSECD